ncbi:hypothetical protein PISMIDRAFT_102836 [Pisolithus microcarpus 441]|uniref:DDE-1 domain-containing protein n=1 Tax=Pisolithus microcarpus 441 TaxID=765257 RepID=A0A0C9YBP6_9AGAM|nr:hypothetical protein PISMIDRAFT_102836 [Pisolithus microcarpus 441]
MNMQIEPFEPNMTSFVQPCDVGIIHCFKALYCCNYCSCTLDLDEAGEQNIYKVDLLKGMMMASSAWAGVSKDTIKHCWDHTQIQ